MRDQVTELLRKEILAGTLAEGDQVREVPLAQRLKVSRGPIRDAILQLSQEGLLKAEPNRGARVGRVWSGELRALMVNLRFELESFAAWRIIESGSVADFDPLRKNVRHFKVACQDGDILSVVQLDLEFHRLILRASGCDGLEAVWLRIMGGMRMPYSRHAKIIEVHAEHSAILAALERGAGKQAITALKRNIR